MCIKHLGVFLKIRSFAILTLPFPQPLPEILIQEAYINALELAPRVMLVHLIVWLQLHYGSPNFFLKGHMVNILDLWPSGLC